MLEVQHAADEEAAVYLAELNTALRASLLAAGGATGAAEAAEAEMVQDAVRAAEGAEAEASATATRATMATIAMMSAEDETERLRQAAERAAERAAEDSGVTCRVCYESRELIQLNCCSQGMRKLCNTCFNRCGGDCPFCRGKCH